MNFRFYKLIIFFAVVSLVGSCKKYKDPDPIVDPDLQNRFYCNDIQAVNYNWGFPGTPDNSLCIFPATLLEGIYDVQDSLFDVNDTFISASTHLDVSLTQLDKQKVNMSNFCTDDITLLCDAYLSILNDTVGNQNWQMCQNDSLVFTGEKLTMDTPNFELLMHIYQDQVFYHKLVFEKK